MNMNDLFTQMTNFRIKHTKNPTPIEVGNMDIVFTTIDIEDSARDILDIKIVNDYISILLGNKTDRTDECKF